MPGLLLCLVLGTVGCGGGNPKTEEYTITVTANPAEGGTASGGGAYKKNEVAKVEVTANEDYIFVCWTEKGTEVSAKATYEFPVTAHRDLVANFTIPEAGAYILSGEVTNGCSGVTIKVVGDEFQSVYKHTVTKIISIQN